VKLYAVVENRAEWGDRIEGSVLPGKVYYATLSMRWGGVSFLTLTPRSPDQRWSHKDEYLSGTQGVEMDPSKTALAKQQLGDTKSMLTTVDGSVSKFDAAHMAERTIHPEDGL
jgi:hypothetical protein